MFMIYQGYSVYKTKGCCDITVYHHINPTKEGRCCQILTSQAKHIMDGRDTSSIKLFAASIIPTLRDKNDKEN